MHNYVTEYIHAAWPNEKASTKHVLKEVSYFADLKGQAAPSLDKIVKRTGLSLRTVQYILRAQQKAGHLLIEPGQGMQTRTGRTNRYTFIGFADWYKGCKGVQFDVVPIGEGVQLETSRGAIDGVQGVQSSAPLEVFKDSEVSTEVKDSDAPHGTSHSQENFNPSEPEPTTATLEQPPSAAPPPTPRSEAQQARDALIEAAAWAWNLDLSKSGSMAGKWVNFCTGQIERGKGKKEPEFYTHQIPADNPLSARDIIGYRVWYDTNPDSAGQIFPTAPETVNRYIETYRASTLSAEMEAKIQRRYDEVVLGIKWELVSLDPVCNGIFDDTPLTAEQQALVDAMPDNLMEVFRKAAEGHTIQWDRRPVLP